MYVLVLLTAEYFKGEKRDIRKKRREDRAASVYTICNEYPTIATTSPYVLTNISGNYLGMGVWM